MPAGNSLGAWRKLPSITAPRRAAALSIGYGAGVPASYAAFAVLVLVQHRHGVVAVKRCAYAS